MNVRGVDVVNMVCLEFAVSCNQLPAILACDWFPEALCSEENVFLSFTHCFAFIFVYMYSVYTNLCVYEYHKYFYFPDLCLSLEVRIGSSKFKA